MLKILTKLMTLLSFLIMVATMMVCFNMETILIEWEIMNTGTTQISLPIIIDPHGMIFLSTVSIITSSVLQFSKFYMKEEKFQDRFIILVMLFVVSMMFMIIFPHAMTLLMGWDGLGITSFVLVIYYQTPKSLGAGLITALTNRVGDVMLLISIAYLLNQGQWLIINIWSDPFYKWLISLITIAAMTKSAQVPFSSWLPAAMAAPTPVSALVHSSTLVTAGVFLLFRFYPLLKSWTMFNKMLMMTATITMLMAGASAMAECDMKKIIALSTLSQLGVMMFTISLNQPNIAFFHLITHALFKALLFICAGFMINSHHHSQDLRTMGNMVTQMPMISSSLVIANMALCGAPFLAGFYSKDSIIELFMISNKNMMIIIMFASATILTTAYSTRFSLYVILSPTQSPSSQYTSESPQEFMAASALTSGAILGGSCINWIMIPQMELPLTPLCKLLPIFMMISGIMMGLITIYYQKKMPSFSINMNALMWFLTPTSTHSFQPMLMWMPLWQLKITDQGWNESPQLLFINNSSLSLSILTSQNNSITTMASSMFLMMITIMMLI
uniref:NADH-ubiquinone oxidoreductase chain 5 n=1 Tax=Paraleonnates uschakovi TaxID=1922336 RepID=A0A343A8R6_9ANNE|nr:NADH dehydrogenase subunit 5 [Paraleonnates uschakovi]APG32416.1 NADH dehydrogenase subunit 5 [Paraleonnates uschakovi]